MSEITPRSTELLQFDLEKITSRFSPKLWLRLGQCQSKCQHISGVPIKPTVAQELQRIYLAKGVFATTSIEGNTLSEAEVRGIIEGEFKASASKEYLEREVINILGVCNKMAAAVYSGEPLPPLTSKRICDLNAAVLEGLEVEEGVPGAIRRHRLTVGRYLPPEAQFLDSLLKTLCDWLAKLQDRGEDRIAAAIIRAIVAHLYLAAIHPFGDGNGRTARLVEFQVLLEAGVPAPAAHLLSSHYDSTRDEYYRQLDRAMRTGESVPFIGYAVLGLLDGLRTQLDQIWTQQLDVAWINLVHETFRDQNTPRSVRLRHLVLDLSGRSKPVKLTDVRDLSPRVARHYADVSGRTLRRDLDELVEMGLIGRKEDGFFPRKDRMKSFLPVSADSDAWKVSPATNETSKSPASQGQLD